MSQRARILWVIAFAIVPLAALSGLTFWQQLQHEQARGANVAGRFSGTGIGLAVARQIVEQHGGSLTVQSELGKGSVFTAHFPALRPCAPKSGRIR